MFTAENKLAKNTKMQPSHRFSFNHKRWKKSTTKAFFGLKIDIGQKKLILDKTVTSADIIASQKCKAVSQLQ